MKLIRKPVPVNGSQLKSQKFEAFNYRRSHYCLSVESDEGELLYNTVNGSIVLVEKRDNLNDILPHLVELWFYVPNSFNEKDWVDVLRKQLDIEEIDTYTILPTMDCNARCFYCYEKGRPRISMSVKVAEDTVNYMLQKSKNRKVRLRWFGGEPLYNVKIIDYISSRLKEEGLLFRSKMVSNGSLFNASVVDRARNLWKLSHVQITLDGTESVYNKRKSYTNLEDNPFQLVINNISLLLEQEINVTIRLNQDENNTQDLIGLAKYLCDTFTDRKRLSVYNSLLFDVKNKLSDSIQNEVNKKWLELKNILEGYGLYKVNPIKTALRCHSCMADSDNAIMITPDGHIGKCEHFTDENMIGSIYSPDIDYKMVNQWKDKINTMDKCRTCILYPECESLKNCPNIKECTQNTIDERIGIIKNEVSKYYQKFQIRES